MPRDINTSAAVLPAIRGEGEAMSILEGLGDIRHTEESEPFVRNMDDYNEMVNMKHVPMAYMAKDRANLDACIELRQRFQELYRGGLISVESMFGVHLEPGAFLEMFPFHDIHPWGGQDSMFTEKLSAQHKGVTFFTIR